MCIKTLKLYRPYGPAMPLLGSDTREENPNLYGHEHSLQKYYNKHLVQYVHPKRAGYLSNGITIKWNAMELLHIKNTKRE